MRIENEIKISNNLDLEFFLFCINEKLQELQIENESFILHNMKMKRLNSEFKQLQNYYYYKNVIQWNK